MGQSLNQNELQHYGVLGMKWGVRKNPSRAFSKASRKARKLASKEARYRLESAKRSVKASKLTRRATTEEQLDKARRLQLKANKENLKSAKLLKKKMKWEKQMGKAFADVKLSDISEKDLTAGKEYVYMLLNE